MTEWGDSRSRLSEGARPRGTEGGEGAMETRAGKGEAAMQVPMLIGGKRVDRFAGRSRG